MATVLLIHGGDAFARRVMAEESRVLWSAALPLVLEKHGLLDVEVAGPEALEPGVFAKHAVVLIARQPEGVWNEALATAAREAPGGVIVEGPLAVPVANELGVTQGTLGGPEGTVQVGDAAVRAAAVRYGLAPGGAVTRGVTRETERDDAQDWRAQDVPITPAQAAAWRTIGWDAEKLSEPFAGSEILATWTPAEGGDRRLPAVVRRGGLVGCSFGLFTFLGQSHTAEPFDGAEWRSWPRTEALEVMLLALIDLLCARAGRPRARMLPWPQGIEWVLNVRHDFDRAMKPAEVREILGRHEAAGTSATWYWRSRHLAPPGVPAIDGETPGEPTGSKEGNTALRAVAVAGRHEVALHTERPWSNTEKTALEAVTRRPALGSSAHGDPSCFRFQGAPNVMYAERERLRYTELPMHVHLRPHRFAMLAPDGTVAPLDVICLPHHASFDRSTAPGDTAIESVLGAAGLTRRAGGLLQVLSHPDIHADELFAMLEDLPGDRRMDWTAAEAADWWRRTHVRGVMELRVHEDGAVTAACEAGVNGAIAERLLPDGTAERFVLDLVPGRPVVIPPPAG